MKGRIIGAAWISFLLIGGLVVVAIRGHPVSTMFLGYTQSGGDRQAQVLVRNSAGSPLCCYGHVVCSRDGTGGQVEVRQPFGLTLDRRQSRILAVTVPRGDGPVRVGCEVMLVDRHCAVVRWVGDILRRAGIYVYHSASALSPRIQAVALAGFPQASYLMGSASNLKIQINGAKPADSLSDFLVFDAFTNSWPTQ